MAMAGATFLQSVATKMARVPPSPRLPSALQHHGHGLLPTSSNRLWFSSFSTSTGSTPQPTIQRGPQTYNNKVPSGSEYLSSFIAGFLGAAPMAAYGLVIGGSAFTYFYVIPALDRLNTQMEAHHHQVHAFNKEMQQRNERRHAALNSMGSQIEARDEVDEFF